jgi:hypothetical protein
LALSRRLSLALLRLRSPLALNRSLLLPLLRLRLLSALKVTLLHLRTLFRPGLPPPSLPVTHCRAASHMTARQCSVGSRPASIS